MSILDKIRKNSTIKETSILNESKFFNKDMIKTDIPVMNVALAGSLDGGLVPGLTTIAGPSKHFKTSISLLLAKAYLDKYPEAALLFYDSEFGSPGSYFAAFGIDLNRVVHTPIMNIEELKFDLISQLESIERKDKVIILIDSVGNLASKKEVDDAIDGKSVADMSRAKQMKSLFRMVTPYLTKKDLPLIAINHTYKTQEMYSKDVVSGGCLIAGTKIEMSDGTYRNIEDVRVGDFVKTLLGDRKTTHIWNPETLLDGNPECFEVEFEDGYKVICSDAHKFLVNGEWVEAKNLKVQMDVSVV